MKLSDTTEAKLLPETADELDPPPPPPPLPSDGPSDEPAELLPCPELSEDAPDRPLLAPPEDPPEP